MKKDRRPGGRRRSRPSVRRRSSRLRGRLLGVRALAAALAVLVLREERAGAALGALAARPDELAAFDLVQSALADGAGLRGRALAALACRSLRHSDHLDFRGAAFFASFAGAAVRSFFFGMSSARLFLFMMW